jgi:hypothetical protein
LLSTRGGGGADEVWYHGYLTNYTRKDGLGSYNGSAHLA